MVTTNNCTRSTPFSVIVPTKNGAHELPLLLESISRQSLQPAEVVIIDSASDDDTVGLAKRWGAQVIEIDARTFNHGATRNQAIAATSTDYIFLFTQDAQPAHAQYFEVMLQSMEQHQAAGVYARQLPRSDASYLVRRDLARWLSGLPERRVIRWEALGAVAALSPFERFEQSVFDNVASLIRRSTWQSIPFPVAPFGEDLEWGFRVLCNGGCIVYEPDAPVIHSHERSARYLYRRTFIDHYRLYRLFGVRTLPRLRYAIRAMGLTWARDSWDSLRAPIGWGEKWRLLCSAPANAVAGVWAQYLAGRKAARGEPPFDTRDV